MVDEAEAVEVGEEDLVEEVLGEAVEGGVSKQQNLAYASYESRQDGR